MLDDLWRHPGISASRAHLSGFVPLSCQAEVSDLEGVLAPVLVIDVFQDQN